MEGCRYFRAGVGTVIYNDAGEVAIFKRAYHPVNVWQFQQGEIDIGETIETTLWRELHEEVGLTKVDVTDIVERPHWTIHEYPQAFVADLDDPKSNRLGQAHKWFFMKIKPGVTIDLNNASTDEFSDFKWVTFEEAIAGTPESKQIVYHELFEFFKSLRG